MTEGMIRRFLSRPLPASRALAGAALAPAADADPRRHPQGQRGGLAVGRHLAVRLGFRRPSAGCRRSRLVLAPEAIDRAAAFRGYFFSLTQFAVWGDVR